MTETSPRTPIEDRMRILVVCTGNICRSPFAAALLQAGFDAVSLGTIAVDSAGTHAGPGLLLDARAAEELRSRGLPADGHASRRLDARMCAEYDLVLGMERTHVAEVLEEWPGGLRRTFTLRGLATLLEQAPTCPASATEPLASMRHLVDWAADHRSLLARGPALDISDPYRREDAHYAAVLASIASAADGITGRFASHVSRGGS